MIARWFVAAYVAALVVLLSPPTISAQGLNIDVAKKEGKLVAYGTILPQVMDPLHRGFEKNTASRSTTGALRRLK